MPALKPPFRFATTVAAMLAALLFACAVPAAALAAAGASEATESGAKTGQKHHRGHRRAAKGKTKAAAGAKADKNKTTSKSGSGTGEDTPLNLTGSSPTIHTSSGGASIVRTVVGLAIVLAVIWGLSWILRQVKAGRDPQVSTKGLKSVSALTLSTGRSVHLVRAGNEYVLLGSAEHGVVPIHRYTEEEAREAGLVPEDEDDDAPRGPFGGPRGPFGGGGGSLLGGRSPRAPRGSGGAGGGGGGGTGPTGGSAPQMRMIAADPFSGSLIGRLRSWTVIR